ncbi:MAG: hypothetical protein SPLM_09450 [Spiroplasma phoeniceum]|uniref:hypothetical protein n=1 Tax=Spiroplasma phoeniceum TaxID=47835 RepID=UPI0031341B63
MKLKLRILITVGFTVFNYLKEHNYPFEGASQHKSGYHFRTQIVFHNDGVKLKMNINYELWVMETNRFTFGSNTNGNFKIEIDPLANIKLKEK